MVDIEPNLYLDSIRRETISRVSPRARGVEIRPLTGYEDFLLKGAVALVLWQPYREVHQDSVRISQMAKKPTKLRSQLIKR
jgi:hypothetical protein